MALGEDPYRRFCPPDLERLRDSVSVLAERTYLHLALGRFSRASNATRVNLDSLRAELREHSRAKVEDALRELEAENWLSIDWPTLTIWLPMQAQRCATKSSTTRQGYLAELAKLPPCSQREQASDFIQNGTIPYRYGMDTVGIGYRSKKQKKNQKQKQNSSSAIATEDTPAVAVVAQAVELELTAPAKPARTLTAGQQDAIFAKQMIRMFADRWNTVMAGDCAPVVAKSLDLKATTLAKNCAVIKHIDEETTPGADLSKLYEWAQARHDYHAGKTGRPWTFEAWHAADHLAQVFADYRQERLQAGGPKNFAFNVDRTLTQWRESVEYRQQREADHGA